MAVPFHLSKLGTYLSDLIFVIFVWLLPEMLRYLTNISSVNSRQIQNNSSILEQSLFEKITLIQVKGTVILACLCSKGKYRKLCILVNGSFWLGFLMLIEMLREKLFIFRCLQEHIAKFKLSQHSPIITIVISNIWLLCCSFQWSIRLEEWIMIDWAWGKVWKKKSLAI